MNPPNVIDISLKALIREAPAAVLRLAGIHVSPDSVRVEDSALNLPELRADHVLILQDEEPTSAVYLEYQLHADPGVLPDWFAKCAGLTRQLGIPVVLLAIYLEKGDRATFPNSYCVEIGGARTEFN